MWTNIHWIQQSSPGKLGTMARPRGGDWLEDEIRHMRRCEVDVVVSALTPQEASKLDLAEEAGEMQRHDIEFVSFPIHDRRVPERAEPFVEFAKTMAQTVRAGKTVVTHCRQGVGRASLLAAGILGALGHEHERAWALIEEARGRPVPDTPEQRQWTASVWEQLNQYDAAWRSRASQKHEDIELIETWPQLVEVIEEARDEGAVVFLKWDGERERGKHTVLLNNPSLGIGHSRHPGVHKECPETVHPKGRADVMFKGRCNGLADPITTHDAQCPAPSSKTTSLRKLAAELEPSLV